MGSVGEGIDAEEGATVEGWYNTKVRMVQMVLGYYSREAETVADADAEAAEDPEEIEDGLGLRPCSVVWPLTPRLCRRSQARLQVRKG